MYNFYSHDSGHIKNGFDKKTINGEFPPSPKNTDSKILCSRCFTKVSFRISQIIKIFFYALLT